MKHIALILLSLVLLTACGQKQQDTKPSSSASEDQQVEDLDTSPNPERLDPSSQVDHEPKGKVSTTTKVTPKPTATSESKSSQELKAQLDQCAPIVDQDERDGCYWKYAANFSSWDVDPESLKDYEICSKITKNSWKSADCYWFFAMKYKDQSLCSNLPASISEIQDSSETYGDTKSYLTKNICLNNIFYAYLGAEWSLSAGTPPFPDPGALEYVGQATLTGWLVTKSEYIDNPTQHFHVSSSDAKLLPYSQQSHLDYSLKHVSQGILDKLADSTEANPATIKVTKLTYVMEGSPNIYISEVTEY